MNPDVRRLAAALLAVVVALAGVPLGTSGAADAALGGVLDPDTVTVERDTHAEMADERTDETTPASDQNKTEATLTYNGVEYRVIVPSHGTDSGSGASADSDRLYGEPVDGDRYLVHVVLVSESVVDADLETLGAEVHLRVGRDVEVLADIETIERLRAAAFVETVRPVEWLRPPGPNPQPIDREALSDDLRTATVSVALSDTETDAHVVSEGVARMRADRVHDRGITGEGVTVGVFDGGFDPSNPEFADNLVAYRSFTVDGSFDGLDGRHGTGVTELVVDVAPGAQIYYAEAETDLQYVAAIEWLRTQGVDVITSSLFFLSHPDTPKLVDSAVTDATRAGVVTVMLAGNQADRFWTGPSRDVDRDGWQEFDMEGTELTALNDGLGVRADATFGVFLYWDDYPTTDSDYRIVLYEQTGPTTLSFAAAWDFDSGVPWEGGWYTTFRENGPLFLAIERTAGTDPHQLEFSTIYTSMDVATPEGTVYMQPSTALETIVVGAYDQRSGQLTGYSSQGPTPDGRRGVDLVAPSHVSTTAYEGYTRNAWGFSGTSAVTPHVAGLAALLLQANPDLSPSEVESILTETAIDAGVSGPDTATGYGYVDAEAAVQVALGEVPAPDRVPPSSRAPIGEWTLLFVDDDHPDFPVGIAAVYAQHDTDTLYLRYEFHGDYTPRSPTAVQALVDADRDPTTGVQYDPVPDLGIDYGVLSTTWAFEFSDSTTATDVPTGVAATYFAPDYAGDAHVVGVSRAALGNPEDIDLAFRDRGAPVFGEFVYDHTPDGGPVTYTFDDPNVLFSDPVPLTQNRAPPQDLDGDGLYEDVDGDGNLGFDDAALLSLVDAAALTPAQVAAFDFDGDGDLDRNDAVALGRLV